MSKIDVPHKKRRKYVALSMEIHQMLRVLSEHEHRTMGMQVAHLIRQRYLKVIATQTKRAGD